MKLFIKEKDKEVFEIYSDPMVPSVFYKRKIQEIIGMPIDNQRLIFAGSELIRPHSGLQRDSTLHLIKRAAQFSLLPFNNQINSKYIEEDMVFLRKSNYYKVYKTKEISTNLIEVVFVSKLDIYNRKEIRVQIEYSKNYPIEPFLIQVTTPIYHPLVNIINGSVRLPILHNWNLTIPDDRYPYFDKPNSWRDPYKVLDIIQELSSMFDNFEFESPICKGNKNIFVAEYLQTSFCNDITQAKLLAQKLSSGSSLFMKKEWTPEVNCLMPKAFGNDMLHLLFIIKQYQINIPIPVKYSIIKWIFRLHINEKLSPWQSFKKALDNIY